VKTWLYTWVALSSIVQNFADGYVWFPLGFVSVWCILENFFVFFKCWLLLIVAAYINKLINTKTVPWLEQMKPHIFWFFQATKPIECMRNEIGERETCPLPGGLLRTRFQAKSRFRTSFSLNVALWISFSCVGTKWKWNFTSLGVFH